MPKGGVVVKPTGEEFERCEEHRAQAGGRCSCDTCSKVGSYDATRTTELRVVESLESRIAAARGALRALRRVHGVLCGVHSESGAAAHDGDVDEAYEICLAQVEAQITEAREFLARLESEARNG
jgi:hypothetical protein